MSLSSSLPSSTEGRTTAADGNFLCPPEIVEVAFAEEGRGRTVMLVDQPEEMAFEEEEEDGPDDSVAKEEKPKVKLPRRSKDSVAFHRDPFNRPELVHTLRGSELFIFCVLYALGVLAIVVMFESVMPVFFVDERTRAEQRRRASIVFSQQQQTADDKRAVG